MFLSCFFFGNYIAKAVATVISIRLSQGVKITWIALFSKHHDFKTHTYLIQFVSLLKDSPAGCSLIPYELMILRQMLTQCIFAF